MLSLRLTLLVAAAAIASDAPPPLKVIRATPEGSAEPRAVVAVTFDRPVAGSLDRSVDPRAVLALAPEVPGTFDWRDPVTVRFRPAAPLVAALTITVTVRTGVTAMDGSTLAEPYRFSFRVSGPRVLAGSPAGPGHVARFLAPDARFTLALSAPADSALLARLIYLEMNRACPSPGAIALRPGSQSPIPSDAPSELREAGGWQRDRSADPLRRIVTLVPVRPLPSVADTADLLDRWMVSAELKPRTGYLVRLDSALTDAFGQRIAGYPVKAFGTTGYRPSVSYVQGRTMVERSGRRTLGITYVNVDTLEVLTIPVPDSLEGRFLSRSRYAWGDDWKTLQAGAVRRTVVLGAVHDRVSLYGLELPAPDATRPGTPTLFLLRATSPRLRRVDQRSGQRWEPNQPIALAPGPAPGARPRPGPATPAPGCSAARSLTRPASRGSAASSGRPLRTRTAAWTGRSKASTATSRRGSGATGRWSASTSGIPTSRRGGSTSPPPGETSGFPWPPRFSPSGASIARATRCSPRRSCGPASSARSGRRRGPIRSGSSSRTAIRVCCARRSWRLPRSARCSRRCGFPRG